MTIKNVPNVTQFQLRKMVKKIEFKDTNVTFAIIDSETKREIN